MPSDQGKDIQEQQIAVSRNVMRLLDDWRIGGEAAIRLLALPAETRTRHLDKFRRGHPFPDNTQVRNRIEHIAGIADALRTMFPRNAHMAPRWLQTPHKRFNNQTPVQIMLAEGLPGLLKVRAEIDCTFAWDQSGSKHE